LEGSLHETSLESVLELVNLARQSGRLNVDAELPLMLELISGEVVTGGILDWQGFEAIQAFPLHETAGTFKFLADATLLETPRPTLTGLPFQGFMTEWARTNDEWSRVRSTIDSPSRGFEYLGNSDKDKLAVFAGGKSIRTAARAKYTPVLEMAQMAMVGVSSGKLKMLERYAWHGMKIQHAKSQKVKSVPNTRNPQDLPLFLNGERRLDELINDGFEADTVRIYLVNAIRSGEIKLPGGGWLMRDLTWEFEQSIAKNAAKTPVPAQR
jgi:Domain of unknown function (DUF4388)